MKTIRNLAIVGLILVIGLYLKGKPEPPKLTPEQEFKQVVDTTISVIPAAAIAKTVADIEKPIKNKEETLPEGEFVTTERLSAITSDGVKGIQKGTKVKRVEEKNELVFVSDGKVTIAAKRGQLTNLVEEANKLILAQEVYIAPVIETPEPPPVVEQETPKVPLNSIKKDNSNQIKELKRQILELEGHHSGGKINANGALIARLKIELNKLQSQ